MKKYPTRPESNKADIKQGFFSKINILARDKIQNVKFESFKFPSYRHLFYFFRFRFLRYRWFEWISFVFHGFIVFVLNFIMFKIVKFNPSLALGPYIYPHLFNLTNYPEIRQYSFWVFTSYYGKWFLLSIVIYWLLWFAQAIVFRFSGWQTIDPAYPGSIIFQTPPLQTLRMIRRWITDLLLSLFWLSVGLLFFKYVLFLTFTKKKTRKVFYARSLFTRPSKLKYARPRFIREAPYFVAFKKTVSFIGAICTRQSRRFMRIFWNPKVMLFIPMSATLGNSLIGWILIALWVVETISFATKLFILLFRYTLILIAFVYLFIPKVQQYIAMFYVFSAEVKNRVRRILYGSRGFDNIATIDTGSVKKKPVVSTDIVEWFGPEPTEWWFSYWPPFTFYDMTNALGSKVRPFFNYQISRSGGWIARPEDCAVHNEGYKFKDISYPDAFVAANLSPYDRMNYYAEYAYTDYLLSVMTEQEVRWERIERKWDSVWEKKDDVYTLEEGATQEPKHKFRVVDEETIAVESVEDVAQHGEDLIILQKNHAFAFRGQHNGEETDVTPLFHTPVDKSNWFAHSNVQFYKQPEFNLFQELVSYMVICCSLICWIFHTVYMNTIFVFIQFFVKLNNVKPFDDTYSFMLRGSRSKRWKHSRNYFVIRAKEHELKNRFTLTGSLYKRFIKFVYRVVYDEIIFPVWFNYNFFRLLASYSTHNFNQRWKTTMSHTLSVYTNEPGYFKAVLPRIDFDYLNYLYNFHFQMYYDSMLRHIDFEFLRRDQPVRLVDEFDFKVRRSRIITMYRFFMNPLIREDAILFRSMRALRSVSVTSQNSKQPLANLLALRQISSSVLQNYKEKKPILNYIESRAEFFYDKSRSLRRWYVYDANDFAIVKMFRLHVFPFVYKKTISKTLRFFVGLYQRYITLMKAGFTWVDINGKKRMPFYYRRKNLRLFAKMSLDFYIRKYKSTSIITQQRVRIAGLSQWSFLKVIGKKSILADNFKKIKFDFFWALVSKARASAINVIRSVDRFLDVNMERIRVARHTWGVIFEWINIIVRAIISVCFVSALLVGTYIIQMVNAPLDGPFEPHSPMIDYYIFFGVFVLFSSMLFTLYRIGYFRYFFSGFSMSDYVFAFVLYCTGIWVMYIQHYRTNNVFGTNTDVYWLAEQTHVVSKLKRVHFRITFRRAIAFPPVQNKFIRFGPRLVRDMPRAHAYSYFAEKMWDSKARWADRRVKGRIPTYDTFLVHEFPFRRKKGSLAQCFTHYYLNVRQEIRLRKNLWINVVPDYYPDLYRHLLPLEFGNLRKKMLYSNLSELEVWKPLFTWHGPQAEGAKVTVPYKHHRELITRRYMVVRREWYWPSHRMRRFKRMRLQHYNLPLLERSRMRVFWDFRVFMKSYKFTHDPKWNIYEEICWNLPAQAQFRTRVIKVQDVVKRSFALKDMMKESWDMFGKALSNRRDL